MLRTKCKWLHSPEKLLKVFYRSISFKELNIDYSLVKKLNELGIRDATEIQCKEKGTSKDVDVKNQALSSLQDGKSVVLNSETGSGKTLAYALPIVQKIRNIRKSKLSLPSPYALIITPNMELAYQVGNTFRHLTSRVYVANEDTPLILQNNDIIVTTSPYVITYPLDIFNQLQTIVIDEADIQITKKIGKHGIKGPLFQLVKHFIAKENQPVVNDYKNAESLKMVDIRSDEIDFIDESTSLVDSSIESSSSLNNSNSFSESYKEVGIKDTMDRHLISSNSSISNNDFLKRQFVFVGATMPDSESKKSKMPLPYIKSWVPNIDLLQVANTHKLVPLTNMTYINVLEGNKQKQLIETVNNYMLDNRDKFLTCRIIVFVNKLDTAVSLHKHLTSKSSIELLDDHYVENEYFVSLNQFHNNWANHIHVLHKKVPIEERLFTFEEFSTSQNALLITTDVSSRGLDFPGVDLVIQYDFATNVIDTIHRVGRTGRMGKQGSVINFITSSDEYLAQAIQEAVSNQQPLNELFSRHRSLQRKIKRQSKDKYIDGNPEEQSVA